MKSANQRRACGRQNGAENKTTRHLKDALLLAVEDCGDLSGIKNLSKQGVEKGKDPSLYLIRTYYRYDNPFDLKRALQCHSLSSYDVERPAGALLIARDIKSTRPQLQALSLVSVGPQGHHDHPARDRRALASCRLSPVWALEIPIPWRSAADRGRSAGPDPAHERR
jgi:hypothetical protein